MNHFNPIPPIELSSLQARWSAHSQSNAALLIKYVTSCDSTNLQLCHSPRQHNTLLVAEHQTHGRGQLDKTWHSTSGDLVFSIGLILPLTLLPALSLRVGLALAQVCAINGWQAQLKWPNDVIATHPDTAQRGKLAGILVQSQPAQDGRNAWVVIGVGVNIGARLLPSSTSPSAFAPIGIAQLDAAWINPIKGQREQLLIQIVDTIMVHIETAVNESAQTLPQAWNSFDLWRGEPLSATDATGKKTTGTGAGINLDGAYQLQTPTDLFALHSGQLQLAPQS